MIKFFRKVRRRMVKENRASKYLLYAIGEIALVVVGILIAFNINNWNEKQKYQLQEIQILSQLKIDLETNLIEINGTYETCFSRLRMCDSILVYLNNERPLDDSLKLYFEMVNNDGLFNNSNTTYRYIQSQGANFLRNDSLRSRITHMYERDFENIFSRQKLSNDVMLNHLRPAYDQFFKPGDVVQDTIFSIQGLNTPVDIQQLYCNQPFKNIIVRLRKILGIRTHWLTQTTHDLELLIEEVQIEIDQLSE